VRLWRDFETFPTLFCPFLETMLKKEREVSEVGKRNCCKIKELCDLCLFFSML
jgi:hypothetical protein